MRSPFRKSIQLAMLTVAVGVAGLLLPHARAVFAGDSAGNRAELGAWGVDLTARNLEVKPGDDFYRYANGHWLDTYQIP